jgi:tetratricopeptide (TPR) repeat protein
MNGKALVPIVLVVLVILTLAPGPILAAESKKQDPARDFDQRFAEGVRLHDAGQYDAAIAVYRDLLKDYPKNPRVLYEVAFSSLSGGKPKDAVDYAARCLKQRSKYDSECHQIMGNAYDDLGEHTKGEKAFRDGLREVPRARLLHFNLGVNLMNQKKTADGIAEFQAGLQEEPEHPGSWRALGVALQMAGQRARSFVAFARFLTLEPDSQRSPAAASGLWNLLFEGVKSTPKEEGGKPGDVSITIPPPKEGDDPATAERLVISMVAASRYLDEWKDKSDAQFFAHALEEVLAILTELDDSAKTKDPFWSVVALPYYRNAREAGHLEAMAYSVRRSLKDPDTLRWLADHAEAVDHYRAWSEAWKPAAPATGQ